MPTSEIDDIFAAKPKGKAKVAIPAASTSATPSTEPSKKSKKKKSKDAKRKREADDDGDSQPAKRRVPETVLDPSVNPQPVTSKATPPKYIKAAKLEKLAAGGATTKRSKVDKEAEARFRDSRGNGPRTCDPLSSCFLTDSRPTGRKTEEGFAIYKEDELGISDTGGSTRSFLAALDPQSSSSYLQTRRYARSTVIAVSQGCLIMSSSL